MLAKGFQVVIALVLLCSTCYGQATIPAYRQFGSSAGDLARWEAIRKATGGYTADGKRPVLPGVNGRNLELLQDGIARKWTRKVVNQSLSAARTEVAKITPYRLPAVRGYMAEAVFLDKNLDWNYVGKTNASQHDVYAKMPDGRPGIRTGQVKFHMSGKPTLYARDMVKDYRSGNFFVPDDHVDSLRTHLKAEADRMLQSGDKARAEAQYRNMNRVKGLGATSSQVDQATRQAITEARVVRVAPYVFVGVATSLLVAPTILEWSQGEIDGLEATHRLSRGGSVVLSAIAADQALKRWKGGLLRGSLRGNIVTACAVLMMDTSWEVYQYGGVSNAMQNPEFIINLGGGVSATTLGLAGGYVGMVGGAKAGGAIGSLFGPEGAPIGATIGGGLGGLVVGSAAGMAGYFGGAKGTRWAMEKYSPEKLYKQEQVYIRSVIADVDGSIARLQAI